MNKLPSLVLAASVAMIIASCSSSDSGTTAPVEAPIGDISGGWSVFETAISSTSECNGTESYDVTITQNDSAITVTGQPGDIVTGTLSGSALSLTGSRAEDPGVVTYNSIKATIPADCSSFTAQTTWTYNETGFTCNGTGTITATRNRGGTTC